MSSLLTTGAVENSRLREKVRQLIEIEGGSAKKFFESCGIKQQTGDRWIQDQDTRIPAWAIAKIAKAKGRPVAFFFEDDDGEEELVVQRDRRRARLLSDLENVVDQASEEVVDLLGKLVGVLNCMIALRPEAKGKPDDWIRWIASADVDDLEKLEKRIAELRNKKFKDKKFKKEILKG